MTLDAKKSKAFVLDEETSLEIINNLPKLKILYLSGCVVYKSGLENIMQKCTCLESMAVVDCEHAMSLKYPSGEKAWYCLRKHTTNNDVIEWSTTLSYQLDGKYLMSSILYHLW
ncbi:hypothetical protein IFM89_037795 [Coptis chinensis]|uniref:Uncharacterized protein n=1 Tax=Coptis chinensis TaxID=261450 RepID=A0A835LKS7_9MAGN|nr:hypothetical protein IFM89_037795 [Coptis chinensis]